MKETVKAILEDTLTMFFAVILVILYFALVFCLPIWGIILISNGRIETLLIILYVILAGSFTYAIYNNI